MPARRRAQRPSPDRGSAAAPRRSRIVAAQRKGDRALADGGNEVRRVEQSRRLIGETEAFEPRQRQDRRVDLSSGELGKPRLDIAAQQRDGEIGPQPQQHGAPTQRRGADDTPRRQVARVGRLGGDPDVPHIFTRQKTGDANALRQERRQVFGGMNGKVDLTAHEGAIEFLGEQALAAGLRQRAILDRVPGRADRNNLDLQRAVGHREPAFHLFGLRQGEGAAARAEF